MTITPDQARELLDGTTPGPWKIEEYDGWPEDGGGICLDGPDMDSARDLWLAAAAPDLAQTVIDQGKRIEELEKQNAALRATDTSEWGVQHGTTVICLDFYGTEDEESGHIRWTPDRPRAEAWKKTMEDCFPGETYRLVRRPVGSAVVVDGE